MKIVSEWWKKTVDPLLFYDILQGLKALCVIVTVGFLGRPQKFDFKNFKRQRYRGILLWSDFDLTFEAIWLKTEILYNNWHLKHSFYSLKPWSLFDPPLCPDRIKNLIRNCFFYFISNTFGKLIYACKKFKLRSRLGSQLRFFPGSNLNIFC